MAEEQIDPLEPVAEPDLEHLWQFAGQGLKASDFNTAMVHFYRGEVTRSNTWRVRLDTTTNWAVITTAGTLTFAFGEVKNPSSIILINTLLVLLFLFIEARRYRYYELWANRVRIIETNFFSALLSPPFLPHADWADKISRSLEHPTFPISLLEALGRRYRRNYAPIFLILAISWIFKILIHPEMAASPQEFLDRAAIGFVPGWLVIAVGILFNGLLLALGFFTVGLRATTSEVLGEEAVGVTGWIQRFGGRFRRATWEALEVDLPISPRSALSGRKRLAFVISDNAEEVGKTLLADLGRGVTLLHGTGMYTGHEHGVLMCALSSRQVGRLQATVKKIDEHAFVMITPLQEVLGEGFRPLEA
jgi:uncharacterized membrane protein